jgi:double-GTPase-like protein
MSDGSRLLLVGLRESGKTSFLAALWHLIEAGEVPTYLTSSQLQPDREYLNRIRASWLKFQQVGRTSLRDQQTVSLLLRETNTNQSVDLIVPDLSGETFRLQWSTRKATRSFADFAKACAGILLFVHPGHLVKGTRIPVPDESTLVKEARTLAEMPPAATDELSNGQKPKEWSHDLAPTQVQLVDLLQMMAALHQKQKSYRVGVIISAWDLVRDPILPSAWLENHLPLLYQYLVANSDIVPFRVYGVSAIGGDLVKDLKRLQDEPVPAHRIQVIDTRREAHHDLTSPIPFVLGLEVDQSPANE